jgi:hypothetical protein
MSFDAMTLKTFAKLFAGIYLALLLEMLVVAAAWRFTGSVLLTCVIGAIGVLGLGVVAFMGLR